MTLALMVIIEIVIVIIIVIGIYHDYDDHWNHNNLALIAALVGLSYSLVKKYEWNIFMKSKFYIIFFSNIFIKWYYWKYLYLLTFKFLYNNLIWYLNNMISLRIPVLKGWLCQTSLHVCALRETWRFFAIECNWKNWNLYGQTYMHVCSSR